MYLRRAQNRRCGCFSDVSRESNIDCPYCTGTGWLYKDEKRLVRKMPLTDPVVAALLQTRSPVGLVGTTQFVFWLGPDVSPGPSRRDLILEVTLDESTGEPVEAKNIETIWNIGQVQDYRDKGGRIEFWACWVREGALGKE